MKTTLYLDDNLYRRAKIKALEDGRTVSQLIEIGLEMVLSGNPLISKPLQRVPLPLIESVSPEENQQLTPESGSGILLAQEADWARPDK